MRKSHLIFHTLFCLVIFQTTLSWGESRALVKRIVVLTPAGKSIISSIGASDLIVGDYTLSFGERVSGEAILCDKADLIYGSAHMHEYLGTLGVPLFLSEGSSVASVIKEIRDIARLTGYKEGADKLIDEIDSALLYLRDTAQKTKKKQKKRVIFLICDNPPIAAGGGTFISDMIDKCGAVNLFLSKQGYPLISGESLAALPCDLIVHSGDYDNDLILQPGAALPRALREMARLLSGDDYH